MSTARPVASNIESIEIAATASTDPRSLLLFTWGTPWKASKPFICNSFRNVRHPVTCRQLYPNVKELAQEQAPEPQPLLGSGPRWPRPHSSTVVVCLHQPLRPRRRQRPSLCLYPLVSDPPRPALASLSQRARLSSQRLLRRSYPSLRPEQFRRSSNQFCLRSLHLLVRRRE